jgi:hypothetical protein
LCTRSLPACSATAPPSRNIEMDSGFIEQVVIQAKEAASSEGQNDSLAIYAAVGSWP